MKKIDITDEELDLITNELEIFNDVPEEVQYRMIVINTLLRKYYREMVGEDVASTYMTKAILVCEQYFNMNEGEA